MSKSAKIKRLEVDEIEQVHLQQVFLNAFLEYGKFTAACNVLQNTLGKESGAPKAADVVSGWFTDQPEFKTEFDKADKQVEWMNAQKVKDFLAEIGSGEKLSRKDEKITNAHVAAGAKFLEAFDKQKYSPKVPERKVESQSINTIIVHCGDKATEVKVIDATDVKELPDGSSDTE
jgi:hypothetical protein